VVTITSSGMANGTAVGMASVTAVRDGITSNGVSITVTPPVVATVDSVRVTPAPVALPPGASLQLTATVYYDDGSSADRTTSSVWESDTPAVATVDASGRLETWSNGLALVRATFSGVVSPPCKRQRRHRGAGLADDRARRYRRRAGNFSPLSRHRSRGCQRLRRQRHRRMVERRHADRARPHHGTVDTRGVGVTTISATIGATVSNSARLQVDPAAASSVVVVPASTSLRSDARSR
jgi:hypothetical protein